jgi:multimeric flavodoxin WrbA
MKVLVLNGSVAGDPTGERVLAALRHEMQSRAWEVNHVLLRERKIGNCAGDFFCWIRNPGVCNIDDDNRRIARQAANCDLLVFLTPVTFGGCLSILKSAVDHLNQNSLPFFITVNGEVHHPSRYSHKSKLLVIGWMDAPDPQEEAIFHHLMQRNAINLHNSAYVSGIVYAGQPDNDLSGSIGTWVEQVDRGVSSPSREIFVPQAVRPTAPPRRALLLVGSPRGRKSTSQALGGYLFQKLDACGIQTETIPLYPALGSRLRIAALLEAIDNHDLIVLAFPLYISALPGPVTRALELIGVHRAGKPRQQAFAAIVNSGLPEVVQNQTALAICAAFAHRTGLTWMGGLALGGGYGVVNGCPLDELGWRGNSIRASMDLTAASLAAGNPIPEEAVKLMAKQRISKWMILLAGPVGWIVKARKYGVVMSLRRQPYLVGS